MPDTLPPCIFVDSVAAWNTCLEELQQVQQFAIDLESNGLFAYRERICLIQISTHAHDYIIDPLSEIDLAPLVTLIENPKIEKILHASEYDLILMKREHDWDMHNLFDTMWAARLIGYEKIGLASMLNALYGMKIDKKFQRANWCERPLSKGQLDYAQTDTHYLFQLRDDLEDMLAGMGRYDELIEIFEEQAKVRLPDVDFSAEAFWQIQGMRDLTPRGRAILRELNIMRNEIAKRRNRPPFKVFGNHTLLEIADIAPQRMQQLTPITGLRQHNISRYGRRILAAVQKGKKAPIPKKPARIKQHSDAVSARYETLHKWRKAYARQRGVASDVILTRETMWDIAIANPRSAADLSAITSFGPVRRKLYGAEVLSVLRGK
ncbi:MAG TPA: ribonuclease D [Anaerolineae bacterium]|nr:ribonuclease D [Anaerolineae bacterium]